MIRERFAEGCRRLPLFLLLAFCPAGLRAQEPATAPAPPEAAAAAAEPAAAEPPAPARPPLRVLRTGGLKVESAALLLSGQQGGPIPLAVLAVPFPNGGEPARVPVVVEVSGPALLSRLGETPPPVLTVDVAVYALGDQGMIAGSLADTIEVALDSTEAALSQGGLRFWGEIALLPGDYSLRVLVRIHGSATDLGLRVMPLTVPPAVALRTGALLTPLLAAREPSPWLTVRASSGDPALTLASPLSLLAREGFPQARPVLAAPGDLTVELPAFGGTAESFGLNAEIRPEGQATGSDVPLPLTAGERRTTGVAGLTVTPVRLSLPALSPGEYQIRLKRGDQASPPLAVKVVGAGQVPTVWAAAVAAAEGAGGPAPAGERRDGRRSRLPRGEAAAFERSYRAALARLAQGDAAGARTAVAELENGILRRTDGVGLEDLADLEIGVLRSVGKSDARALLPLLELYGENYHSAVVARDYLRSTHARQLALAMADFYNAETASDVGKQTIARFLVGFAAELARGQEPGGFSTWAWKRALEIDANDEVALLCLSIDAEKRGDFREAASYLERLRTAHPESREGKIRLAVQLSRLEKGQKAREILTELTAGPADWITALAYQELGRQLLAGKKPDSAEPILRAGRDKFPDDEKILFELASLLDRQKKGAEARTLLEAYQPRPAGAASARLRYADWPEEAIRRSAADFSERARPHRAELGKALTRLAGGKEGRP